jgi:hypothetical protein
MSLTRMLASFDAMLFAAVAAGFVLRAKRGRIVRWLIVVMVLRLRSARDRIEGRVVGSAINYGLKPYWPVVPLAAMLTRSRGY